MWFRTLFGSQNRRTSRAPQRRATSPADRRQHTRRLFLEGLEDRRLLAFNVLAEYATGPGPADIALAQINPGSQLDLVVVNSGDGTVGVRLGNADGTFGSPLNSPTGGTYSRSVAAGDFTGDGVTDLVAGISASVTLLAGNSDRTFQPAQAISLPGQFPPGYTEATPLEQYPQSVVTGDLNGDGKLDLVVASQTFHRVLLGCGDYGVCYYDTFSDGYVNVLLGNGSGGFGTAAVQHLGRNRVPGAAAVGDINNDGKPDVITASDSGLSVLLGDGAGTVGSPIYSGTGGRSSLSLGDIDGDSILDTVTWSGYTLTVQKGQGDGRFVPSTTANMGQTVESAVVGDVNADGKLDLVSVGSTSVCTNWGYYGCYDGYTARQSAVVLGTGQGSFSLPITTSLGSDAALNTYLPFTDMALVDLTGDGLLDLIALDNYDSRAIVAEGNWPPADAPFISVASLTVVERDAGTLEVSVTVNLSAPYTQTVTADFQTADGTGLAGSDYVAKSGSLTFAPGQTSQTITLMVYGDRLIEADESFSVILTSVVNATVGNHGAVTILDNEPRLSINHPYETDPLTVIEGDVGTTPAVFTVSLAMAYDQEVTVDYSTLTGHTNDIVATAGTLRFTPGETSKTISVQVVGDLLDEPLEAFNVILANPSPNASLANSGGYCYIEDNDPTPPSIRIGDASIVEGNSGTKLMTFTISLSNASGQGVWVNNKTANGTATTSNNDYVAKSGKVYFAPGETIKTITVSIKGDTKRENDEKFYVNLSGAIGGTIADSQGVGTIVNDDGAATSTAKGNKQTLSASAVDAAIDELLLPGQKKRSR